MRLMRCNGLFVKRKKKYIVTTDSRESINIFPNVIKREFKVRGKNEKMVSDTTYIHTREGWLYVAAIMDLYGRKIVGMAISDRNNKELVIEALEDVRNRVGRKNLRGCILHSDRGSTYASKEYKEKIEEYKKIGSMSRKGNCWDNAPMESFWGRMKVEWLKESYEEAIRDVYEYIWSYYNRFRVHSADRYSTPEEYYRKGGIA